MPRPNLGWQEMLWKLGHSTPWCSESSRCKHTLNVHPECIRNCHYLLDLQHAVKMLSVPRSLGHSQGCSSALGGNALLSRHSGCELLIISRFWCRLGYQWWPCASSFIWGAPVWQECISCSIKSHSLGGLTTLVPHKIHPFWMDNFYSSTHTEHCLGHPL